MKNPSIAKLAKKAGSPMPLVSDLMKKVIPQPKKKKLSYDDAYLRRDMNLYGGLNKEDYIKEAKRQQAGGKVPTKPMSSKGNRTIADPKPTKATVNNTQGVLKNDKGNFADNKGITNVKKTTTTSKTKTKKKFKDTKVGKFLTSKKKFTYDPVTGKRKKIR